MENYTTFKNKFKNSAKPAFVPKVPTADDAVTGISTIDSMNLVELHARPDIGMNPNFAEAYRKRLSVLSTLDAIEKTKARLERNAIIKKAKIDKRLETRGKIVAESKIVKGEMSENLSSSDDHENVRDYGGETPVHAKVGQSLVDTPDGQETKFTLDKFFERPVPIYDDDWALDTEQSSVMRVWDLWSKNQAVRAKLSNYAYFKGDLKVKISFSGTPFHYGMVMASYQPYPDRNTNLITYDAMAGATSLPTSEDLNAALKMYLSQAPGCDYISVTDNEPLILDIPFISYKEKFRLWNSDETVITAATSFDDFYEAGSLYLRTLNPIQVANEDYSSAVSFNVYAWVENIELGCVTGTHIDITAESRPIIIAEAKGKRGGNANVGKKAKKIETMAENIQSDSYGQRASKHNASNMETFKESMKDKPMYSSSGNVGERFMSSVEAGVRGDEFSTPGPVETIASAVTKVGDTLSGLPVIGAFAKATSTISSGIGKVASLFGWSKPLVLEKPSYVKNNPYVNGAFTEGPETTLKISCDPKQELTVDPSIGGMFSDDEMTILNIASRESYLTTFSWTDSDVAMTTNLWETIVTPYLHTTLITSSGRAVQQTALEMAATPFRYWRGTIKFRFEIVCSKFHRGKLVFIYEPNEQQRELIESASIQLNQHNTVILDIQESQDITFEVDWAAPRAWGLNRFDPIEVFSVMHNSETITGTTSSQNGFMIVRALNELVQPTDAADVKINVYVSCDDLQVAFPNSDRMLNNRSIYVESKEVINPTGASNDNTHLMHFGEKVLSFRALLKRYTTYYPFATKLAAPGPVTVSTIVATYPQVMSASSDVQSYNGTPFLFEYLRYSFMGMRGGGRYRVVLFENGNYSTDYVRTSIYSNTVVAGNVGYTTMDVVLNEESIVMDSVGAMLSGTVTHHLSSNGGVEFEVPFYNQNLFVFSGQASFGYDSETDPYLLADEDPMIVQCVYSIPNYEESTDVYGVVDYATAEDFTFLRFQGAGLWNSTNRVL